jgi:hypothetical protein
MIALNQGLASNPAAPFSGVKQSSIGYEGGHHKHLGKPQPSAEDDSFRTQQRPFTVRAGKAESFIGRNWPLF